MKEEEKGISKVTESRDSETTEKFYEGCKKA